MLQILLDFSLASIFINATLMVSFIAIQQETQNFPDTLTLVLLPKVFLEEIQHVAL